MDNPDDKTTIINVKGVSLVAWERAKKAAYKRDEAMGVWLTRWLNQGADREAGETIFPPGDEANLPLKMANPPPISLADRAVLINAMAALAQANAALLQAGGRTVGRKMLLQQAEALMQGEAQRQVIPGRKLRVVE